MGRSGWGLRTNKSFQSFSSKMSLFRLLVSLSKLSVMPFLRSFFSGELPVLKLHLCLTRVLNRSDCEGLRGR